MVPALEDYWGEGLKIVGEEDGSEEARGSGEVKGTPLREDLVELGGEGVMARLGDLCVFVDPLDGTREFVEGRVESVTCLIGVSLRSACQHQQ